MKSIDRTVFIPRSADGRDHNSRLVVPEYGVVELRVLQGATTSKSHRLPRSVTPRVPAVLGDDAFHFAPGPQLDPGPWTLDAARHDRVVILYNLYNPFGAIKKAKLELYVRREKSPVWTRELKEKELYDGEHRLECHYDTGVLPLTRGEEWDGALRDDEGEVKKSKRFPDGFVTTEHSPYKLRLVVEGEGMCRSPLAFTYFHVLIDKLELEYGTTEMIPTKKDHRRKFFTDLLAEGTAATADTKLYIPSNQFKSNTDQMFNNHLYDVYAHKWGRGPKLPLVVKVFVRTCGNAGVPAPKALGHTKFMWDWESKSVTGTNAFVNQATNYKVNKDRPKGRNCHKDRGGKRGSNSHVFKTQDGYDPPNAQDGKFPFKVVNCGKPRDWAAYSEAWREGVFASKTGVIFQPARMAGDKYKATCYAAHELNDEKKIRLHVDTDAPLPIVPALKVDSGEFEIWRRIDIVRYMQKSAFGGLNLATLKTYYDPAFVDLNDKTNGNVEYFPAGEWNGSIGGELAGWSNFDKYFVDSAVNQHGGGSQAVILRTRAQVCTYLEATFPVDFPNPGDADPWLTAQGLADDNACNDRFQDPSINIVKKLFNAKVHDDDGINIFHVSRLNHFATYGLMGEAYDFPNATGHSGNDAKSGNRRCGFIQVVDAAFYANYGWAGETPEQTAAHECGHHMMLPHPRDTAENKGKHVNRDYKAHDQGVTDCLMSYRRDVTTKLCGFCQLRMRGWNKDELKTDGAKNEKT